MQGGREFSFSRAAERWRDFFSVPWFGWYWLLAWVMAGLSLYSIWQAGDFFLEKSRFAREGLCTEGTVRNITEDTVKLWSRSRVMGTSGPSLDVWAPEVRFLPQTGEGEVVFQSPAFLFWSSYSRGDRVTVCYPPERPEDARVADSFIWWPETRRALWLMAFLLAGGTVLLRKREVRSSVGA